MKDYVKAIAWLFTNGNEEVSDIICISGILTIVLRFLMSKLTGMENVNEWFVCFRGYGIIYGIFLFTMWLRVSQNLFQWVLGFVEDDDEVEEEES